MECEAESQRKLKKIGDFSRPRARASIERDFFFFCVCVFWGFGILLCRWLGQES